MEQYHGLLRYLGELYFASLLHQKCYRYSTGNGAWHTRSAQYNWGDEGGWGVVYTEARCREAT